MPVSVNLAAGKPLNYVQYSETDFSFLSRLLDDGDGWLRPADGGIEIFGTFQAGTSLSWRSDDGLIDFTIAGMLAPASISGSHYDHHSMSSNTYAKVAKPPEFYDGAARLTGAVQSASASICRRCLSRNALAP